MVNTRTLAILQALRPLGRYLIICTLILVIYQTAHGLHLKVAPFTWRESASSPTPVDSQTQDAEPRPLASPPESNKLPVEVEDKLVNVSTLSDCQGFPATPFTEDIQVTLKTGGAVSEDRLRSHVDSVTACIPNLLVVSDMDQAIGMWHSHDVLADLAYVMSSEDLQVYQRQREDYFYRGKKLNPTSQGWKLDRYKFLSMVEYAYAQNPNAKWYIFHEIDTLVVWSNVLQMLSRYDPRDPLYIGSPTKGRPLGLLWNSQATIFAYGGTGFILSVAGIENLLRDKEPGSSHASQLLATKYQRVVRDDCCGDSVLGWVAAQKDIRMLGLYPMFNPHALHDVPLGPGGFWCQPVISFHRSHPEDMVRFWEWQNMRNRTRGRENTILFSDLISFFDFANCPVRENWNNADLDGYDPPKNDDHGSFEQCRNACHDHPDCLQFTHDGSRCRLMNSIKLGGSMEPSAHSSSGQWIAGWDIEKIQALQEEHRCGPEWLEPSLERMF